MKKSYKAVLLAAALTVLLCSTAFAIVHSYSVRDYMADGKTSEAFNNAVVPLEESMTTNGLTFTLGDAVFDGRSLCFTMNMAADADAAPLYVYPTLRGFCGERELDVDYDGFDMPHDWGFFLPSATSRYALPEQLGVNASLFHDTADGEVIWRYSLALYRPTGELVEIRDRSANETAEDYEAYLQALHADGKIGCRQGTEMWAWLHAATAKQDAVLTIDQRIEATGLFELADVITFEFATAVPERISLTEPAVFDFDGYAVTVKSITQSFMQVDYELEVVYDAPQEHEYDLDQFYTLTDQDGNALTWRSAQLRLDEDKVTVTVVGSAMRISDDPLAALTFTLDHNKTIDPNDSAEDMPSFTVKLDQ